MDTKHFICINKVFSKINSEASYPSKLSIISIFRENISNLIFLHFFYISFVKKYCYYGCYIINKPAFLMRQFYPKHTSGQHIFNTSNLSVDYFIQSHIFISCKQLFFSCEIWLSKQQKETPLTKTLLINLALQNWKIKRLLEKPAHTGVISC